MKLFYDKWLEKDQQEETYIESVFFVNREDAESYIKDVLKGKESLTEVAAEIDILNKTKPDKFPVIFVSKVSSTCQNSSILFCFVLMKMRDKCYI